MKKKTTFNREIHKKQLNILKKKLFKLPLIAIFNIEAYFIARFDAQALYYSFP